MRKLPEASVTEEPTGLFRQPYVPMNWQRSPAKGGIRVSLGPIKSGTMKPGQRVPHQMGKYPIMPPIFILSGKICRQAAVSIAGLDSARMSAEQQVRGLSLN